MEPQPTSPRTLCRRHLIVGWCGLLVFASLGLALETLHGLKLGYYLDVRNETRRLMWTLGHAHGTLLSLVNIAAAWTFGYLAEVRPAVRLLLASRCLLTALVLLPGGFLLGGWKTYAGDPGPGVFLVPLGAVSLLAAAGMIAVALWRSDEGSVAPAPDRIANRKRGR